MVKASELRDKLSKMFDTDEKKIEMIMTMMGMSAVQTQYIASIKRLEHLPESVQYAMVLTAGNMASITSFNPDVHDIKYSSRLDDGYNEHTEENLYRRMRQVIFMFYKMIKEDDEV